MEVIDDFHSRHALTAGINTISRITSGVEDGILFIEMRVKEGVDVKRSPDLKFFAKNRVQL